MNFIGLEFNYSKIFHIIPNVYISFGRSIYISVNWFTLNLIIKRISSKANGWRISFCSPSITLNQYPTSSYFATFEICAFNYMYRKGIWLLEDAPKPFDNTKKFVHSSWLNQFRSDSDNKFLEELAKLFKKLNDK